MSRKGVDNLTDLIVRAIDYVCAEYDMSDTEIIGTLEWLKLNKWDISSYVPLDDDDDSEDWQKQKV